MVVVVVPSGFHRYINGVSLACSLPPFGGPAGTGVVRKLVGAEKEDGRIVLETVLCGVAVMHIPVDDRHALQTVLFLNIASCNRYVIKKAEPHRPVCLGMVTGRPYRTKHMIDLLVQNGIDAGQRTAGGEIGCVQ